MGRKFRTKKDDPYNIVADDGKVIGTIGYGDKILRVEQSEYLEKYDPNFQAKENFVKIFDEVLEILLPKLTNGEIAFIVKILPYISYKDGILRDKNKKIMKLNDLALNLNLTHEGVRRVVISLISKGVLGEHRTGSIDNPKIINKCITTNPFIFMRGRDMNRTIIGLFENTEWNIKLN